jgi:hypothetical protein
MTEPGTLPERLRKVLDDALADMYSVCQDRCSGGCGCEADAVELTATIAAAIDALEGAAQERARLREAWEAGFRLAVEYGDNWIHFDGEQKERQWALAVQEMATCRK